MGLVVRDVRASRLSRKLVVGGFVEEDARVSRGTAARCATNDRRSRKGRRKSPVMLADARSPGMLCAMRKLIALMIIIVGAASCAQPALEVARVREICALQSPHILGRDGGLSVRVDDVDVDRKSTRLNSSHSQIS